MHDHDHAHGLGRRGNRRKMTAALRINVVLLVAGVVGAPVVAADALGSLGVVVSAVVMLATGWRYADPIAGLLIGLLVVAGSWTLVRDALDVLMEAAPAGIDVQELGRAMVAVPGVREVHDLHVWTVTAGFPALAAHVRT